MATELEQKNTFQILASYMSDIGLGSLFSVDTKGNPSGWLWTQVQNGITSREELAFGLETTQEFKQRFPVIFEQRARAAKGENVQVMDAEQVLQYENEYKSTMRNAGLPLWFYDEVGDAHKAIKTGLAVTQIEERINASYNKVVNMPKEVRDAFAEYYGNASDGSLLAAVLDPEKSLTQLDKASKASAIGGFSKLQGLQISKDQAEQYANLGKDIAYAQSDASKVAEYAQIAQNNLGDSASSIDSNTAFNAGALGNIASTSLLEDRLLKRKDEQISVSGGALTTTKGVVGA
jgi:hypothetical protein